MNGRQLSDGELLQLKRWNTPSIYNGWEQITRHDAAKDGVNVEETRDFMPQMGIMVGYAATLVIEPSNPDHKKNANAWAQWYRHIASQPPPTIVVVQDLDKPRTMGSLWGEVTANTHRALGFKAIARRLCVGHAHAWPVRWEVPVEVFGRAVQPGQLVHADKHGFLAIPSEDERPLLEAARFMDSTECSTVIPAARFAVGCAVEEILRRTDQAREEFGKAVRGKFGRKGEW
jgi:regulator of RNase E activity RraA